MADKTVKELAEMVGKTTSAVKQQLVDAGLPARAEDDLVTELEQEKLVTYLNWSNMVLIGLVNAMVKCMK